MENSQKIVLSYPNACKFVRMPLFMSYDHEITFLPLFKYKICN
jgi:hypothetical protein